MAIILSIFFLIMGIVFIYYGEKTHSNHDGAFIGVGMTCWIVVLITFATWWGSYGDRYNDQCWVDSFIESKVYERYFEVAQEADGMIFELESKSISVGTNLNEWYTDIKEVNKIIQEHSRANESFWWDWGYPDWDAPTPITY